MKVLAIVLFTVCLVFSTSMAQVDLNDMPQFPQLAEVGAQAEVVALGPDNNILNGKPLKVPIIVDPFAQEPGSDAAQELNRITEVLTMEPPSAAQPKAVAADQVDILEVLDRAAAQAKKAAKAKAEKKKVKKQQAAAVAAASGKPVPGAKKGAAVATPAQLTGMKAVKKEIESLKKLIDNAKKIQSELPKKKQRLEKLKKKLHKAAAKQVKKLAGKKVGVQSKVASNVAAKIHTLKAKLQKLESAKKLLSKSIDGLKKVASGKAVNAALIQQIEERL